MDFVAETRGQLELAQYNRLLEGNRLPQLFDKAASDLGDRNALVEELAKHISLDTAAIPNSTYDYLAAWPFAGYITTNWDNLLSVHLKYHKKFHRILSNSASSTSEIMEGAGLFVWKFHGELSAPPSAILTQSDYDRIAHGPQFEVARQKLSALFHMYDIMFVGYSLSDFNVRLLLDIGRQARDPRRPFFMFAADPHPKDMEAMLMRDMIQVVPYKNADRRHSMLTKRLGLLDKFILSDQVTRSILSQPDGKLAEAATALYVTRSLLKAERDGGLKRRDCLAPLILQRLSSEVGRDARKHTLFDKEPLRSLAGTAINKDAVVAETLNTLEQEHLILEPV